MSLYNYFNDHPKKVCMNYISHFKFSSSISYLLLLGCVKSFIHAIFPEIYKTNTTELIEEINYKLDTSGCRKKLDNVN